MKKYNEMQKRVCETAIEAYRTNLVAGTSGNVSEYDPEDEIMAVTPSNLSYNIMQPNDVVLMKLNGEILQGELKPSSEWRMHASLYGSRDDIRAAIHTHSPFATSFAVTHEIIPLILVEMLPFLGGDIPLSDFGLPGTDELGNHALKSLKNRNSCLLSNHGVLAVGLTPDQAYIRAVYTEDAARIYHHAKTAGTVHFPPADAIATLKQRYNIQD